MPKLSLEEKVKYNTEVSIGNRKVSKRSQTLFIADIAANHDGDLERAKALIWLAKEAGADVAKFQHFTASTIISDLGFSNLNEIQTHQSGWKKSVFDTYDQYHTRRDWTNTLVETCEQADIQFMTTPYDFEAVDMFSTLIPAYKIGSGDITFYDLLSKAAQQKKPIILATGASSMDDVVGAVDIILKSNPELILLQCNTNYTGNIENFSYVNLKVLKTFASLWPDLPLGLSDHTPGYSAVLGAVTLGARVIEKHFTDDNSRIGPDHKFALNPNTWRNMVDATRELELSLGDGIKRVEKNEMESVIVQRRALRATRDLPKDIFLTSDMLEALRPCPTEAIPPSDSIKIFGKKLIRNLKKGEHVLWSDVQ